MSAFLQTLNVISPLLPWVLASVAVYALATNGLWLVLRRSGPDGWLRGVLRSIPGQLVVWLARVLWLVIPGYVALLAGILSPRTMGLSQIELGWSLGRGLLLAAGALLVLLAAGLSYRRARGGARPPYLTFSHGLTVTVLLVVEAGALQWQWAFYRSAMIDALAGAAAPAPVYWATWLGAALLVVQGALSPWLWRDLRTPGLAERRILRAALLGASSVLYLLSRNFWLAWALHGAAVAVLEPRVGQPEQTVDKKRDSRQPDSHRKPAQPG